MSVEDIIQEPVPVELDKTRHMLYTNRSFRHLASKYGTVGKALDALLKITPKIRIKKGELDEDGNLAENNIYVPIEQDEEFYDTILNWIYAGLIGVDKTVTLECVSDIIDDMGLKELLSARPSIWFAYMRVIPKTKKESDDSDPTKATV
jgi:hypothetical protein